MIKVRTVSPMSLMTDVFVELERLRVSLEGLRDKLTVDERQHHHELWEARHHCRRIMDELRSIRSLLSLAEMSDRQQQQQAPDPSPPPSSRPRLVE